VAKKESYPDDYRRQTARKKWLLLEEYSGSERSFTQGELTQTSHLNRLSQRQLERAFTDPETGDCTVRIHALPGQVTAEARKAWNLLGTLVPACPECAGKTKTEIREITHLHHALDAMTLGLIHHYMPGRLPGQMENEKGTLWSAMLQRNKSQEEISLLLRTGVFKRTERLDKEGRRLDAELVDLEPAIKNQVASRLAETRVVQHIPADQSGAILELNPWRVWEVKGNPEDSRTEVVIRQRISKVENGKRVIERKEQKEKAGKLIGLKPGKLHKNKSVLVIAENYGMALDPQPCIIPHHKVTQRIRHIRQQNRGILPRVLRNGMLVKIRNIADKEGFWRIFSVKATGHLDLARPDVTVMRSKGDRYWRQVLVTSLMKKDALEILRPPLTGFDPSNH
jgi:CRISPR-associated endonuclease Csn1